MKFIDLFAGLGAFHLALRDLGHECVFGSEINQTLKDTYYQNFGIKLAGDIRAVNVEEIPSFEILCAGFPCQSFSKAGKQKGVEDDRGALFNNILDILKYHMPKYFILENVPQLARHNQKQTWQIMKKSIEDIGYEYVDCREYSPHEFGVPQHRRRIYIVGSLNKLDDFNWIDDKKVNTVIDVRTILDNNVKIAKRLDSTQLKCIDIWQEFLEILDEDEPIGFPVWAYEFRATYPYQRATPFSCRGLSRYKGSFGASLRNADFTSDKLPSYARLDQNKFPVWKQRYISHNRKLYQKYKDKLEQVIDKIEALPIHSWKKFEWNCQFEPRIIKDKILQFRASGLRVKKTDFVPSLVCTNTQTPIIGWENRYITLSEALKLQSFPENFILPKLENAAYQALGNSINVHILKLLAQKLIPSEDMSKTAGASS
jgi:DNA (cytosine-5)-methyltransferase 1